MADNKVKFLRGSSNEYKSTIKDNDTFYYTTDDEKLYIGDKEITGGGVTVDNALSDTSEHPVQNKVVKAALDTKANLSDIPTSLPANGGNADTVGNRSVSGNNSIMRYTVTDGDANTIISTGVYRGTFTNIPDGLTDGQGTLIVINCMTANEEMPGTIGTDDLWLRQWFISAHGYTVYTRTSSSKTISTWLPTNNGGNADTFGGLNTGYFYIHHGDIPDNDCNNARGMGTYNAVPATSNTPFSSYWHIVVEYAANGSWIKQTATQADKTNPLTYCRLFINDSWGSWIKVNINNKPHISSVTATESTIHLKWLPVDSATKYAVSKYNGTGTSYTVLSNAITNTEYTITGLTSGTEYQILVQAYIGETWNTFTTADNIIVRTTPVASASANGLMSTGAQTFAGNKTFNGQIVANGATAVDSSQVRNIYAGSADMIAGTSALTTGTIYVVYE